MYESFFQLQGRPFAAAANRHQYFAAGAIGHARQTLSRCISRAEGPALLIGPAGTGKTLLCQLLADDFAGQLDCVHLASGNLGTSRSLLQVILFELALPYRGLDEGELRLSFLDRVTRQRNARAVLLLADEAQVLPARLLEELRLMTNLVHNGQPQVLLVLSGSAELEERLANPKLESFSQRLAARCYLEAFNRDETRGYVAARIAASGSDVDRVFASDALDQIYQATEGVPRLINQLCDHALVLAYAAELRTLDGRVIKEAWADLQQLPTPWNQTNQPASPTASASELDVIEFGTLDDEPATLPLASFAEPKEYVESAIDFPDLEQSEPEFQFPEIAASASKDMLEEEVVIDPYAALDARTDLIRHRVASGEGRAIWKQLAPFADAALRANVRVVAETTESPAKSVAHAKPTKPLTDVGTRSPSPTPAARPAAESRTAASQPPAIVPAAKTVVPPADDDLIIIEENAEPLELASAPGFGRVRKQDYRQLFKKLRSG